MSIFDTCEVFVKSTDLLKREEWLEARNQGIGGSEAGTILGLNPYEGQWTLWAKKVGKLVANSENEATGWGHDLEPIVAKRFAEQTGLSVIHWPVILRSKANPWQLANVDYFICDGGEPGRVTYAPGWGALEHEPISVLEIKTAGIVGRNKSHQWAGNKIPSHYYWQGVHYCTVTGLDNVTFAALVAGDGLVIREVQIAPDTKRLLTERERQFWEMVQQHREPEAQQEDLRALHQVYPESAPGYVEADAEILEVLDEYRRLKAKADTAEDQLKLARARLERVIGNREGITMNGETLVTYRSTKPQSTVDVKRLQQEQPDLYQKYLTSKPGYRRLMLRDN